MGRLERKLDAGLIRRVAAGIKPPPEALKHKKKPRSANSYRAARRNRIAVSGRWRVPHRRGLAA